MYTLLVHIISAIITAIVVVGVYIIADKIYSWKRSKEYDNYHNENGFWYDGNWYNWKDFTLEDEKVKSKNDKG